MTTSSNSERYKWWSKICGISLYLSISKLISNSKDMVNHGQRKKNKVKILQKYYIYFSYKKKLP